MDALEVLRLAIEQRQLLDTYSDTVLREKVEALFSTDTDELNRNTMISLLYTYTVTCTLPPIIYNDRPMSFDYFIRHILL